jgi:DNA protecting protein DprA
MSAPSARDHEAALALALLDAPGLGPSKVLDLLTRWGSAEAAFEKTRTNEKASQTLRDHLDATDPANYLQQLTQTRELGGDVKLWSDESYPGNLSKWQARPPVLFYKGAIDALTPRALALVGRVDPTDAGVAAATRFARMCVDNNIDVVSGLAKGIDGASHRSALADPPGNTFAVIGHGLDFAYPAENHDLYAAIPNHGAIISQFPIGMGPQRWTFPARNEAMCTLALGTVIIEGRAGCGSIIQADFSFKHGRPVFILSRNLKTEDPGWALDLVKRGAHVIERFEQVTEIVESTMGHLWGEKSVQATFFDVEDMISVTPTTQEEQPRAALFDLDGVVVDTMLTTRQALAEVASVHLRRTVDVSSVPGTGAAWRELKALGVSDAYDVAKSEYQSAWVRHLPSSQVFEEVVATIAALRSDGWKIGAITSQPSVRANKMVPSEVRALFDVFLTYGEGGRDKASAIVKTLDKWRIEKSRAFYIGDQTKDIDAAKEAGVTSVAALWGYSSRSELASSGPDFLLETPRDSNRLLELF